MSRLSIATICLALVAAVLPAAASGHAERASFYPDHEQGSVPKYRKGGPALVVCKRDSAKRIRKLRGKARKRNRNLLRKCRFRHIQDAVEKARNNTRILVLPGLYLEEPSREVPLEDPKCKDLYVDRGGAQVANYEYHRTCPRSQNLIAVVGDGPDEDRRCDDKCNIQIEGTGRGPADVLISGKRLKEGERSKLNVIRADRADGIHLRNFTVEFSDFNNIYALETNGFRFGKIVSRYSREYGLLSFTSDNGLYENLEAFGSGDSGVYPGSGPEGRCERYGIEIRNVDSHGNTIGYSGTAGNGVWAHDNRFHDNATGMTTDSFASGHPGMPQDCAKWERNQIYSNNLDLFNEDRDAYCKQPYEQRDQTRVCPTFQVPVGTGALIAGGNRNLVRDNIIWDNWRSGIRLFYVPSALRGEDDTGQSENDPSNQFDTSHGNRFERNKMSMRPDGTKDPNGHDFWWDEEGSLNCWMDNTTGGAGEPSDPAMLPGCPGSDVFSVGSPTKSASQATCATWNPTDNTDPPGCDWFTRPSEPK